MTNLQLTVIIAAYCSSKEMDIFKDTETYRTQCINLLDAGLIKPNHRSPAGYGYKFEITEKGRFWLDYVLDTPYPVEIADYKIPERIS